MLWFYVSALAVLVGAELNAEIEHASPYGKDPGEKVAGEKKKIGALAERAWRGTQDGRHAQAGHRAAATATSTPTSCLRRPPPARPPRFSDWVVERPGRSAKRRCSPIRSCGAASGCAGRRLGAAPTSAAGTLVETSGRRRRFLRRPGKKYQGFATPGPVPVE